MLGSWECYCRDRSLGSNDSQHPFGVHVERHRLSQDPPTQRGFGVGRRSWAGTLSRPDGAATDRFGPVVGSRALQ